MRVRRISLIRGPFRFFYWILDKDPWVEQAGKEPVAIYDEARFAELICKHGAEAMATAISIAKAEDAKKRKKVLKKQPLILASQKPKPKYRQLALFK